MPNSGVDIALPGIYSSDEFYWPQSRDSSITKVAVQLFQIAANHDGEDFDTAKTAIDDEYAVLRGRASERHGGKFQTAIQAYREIGWLSVNDSKLHVTPAGKQALLLIGETPDFLKAVPQFLVELLARFQLNNPERPPARRGGSDLRASSDVFPYWTIWKVMRECENQITIEELQRFVFRIHRHEQIADIIRSIKAFRIDKASEMTAAKLDSIYGARLEGPIAEPKYWMGRAGMQIGNSPGLIEKPTNKHTYEFNKYYLPLIDSVLANEPVFRDDLSAQTWMAHFGNSVTLASESSEIDEAGAKPLDIQLDDTDHLALEVEHLLAAGSRSFLLTGPPGTSKSWYARQLAARIVKGNTGRVRLVQFHASYGYEDFIEGFVPEAADGQPLPTFARKWKVFAEVCDLARDGQMAVLVIDEFSRGDAGRIFGEALTYIESDYRGQSFRLASGRDFTVPANLVIIATMNPNDRSVSAVDVAMQRRFEVIRMPPNAEILETLLHQNGMEPELIRRVLAFFSVCQEVMPHGGLGHAYFHGAKNPLTLKRLWTYKLEPLFQQELQYAPEDLARVVSAYQILMGE